MKKPRIAILSPFNGTSTRGTETFVTEFTKALRDGYDITVFSYGLTPEIAEQTQQVEQVNIPLLRIYANFYKTIETSSSKGNLFAKVLLKILTISTYFNPGTIEQYFFTKVVYERHIAHQAFDILFPNNGIWGVKMAQHEREKYARPFIYTGHGGIGKEEKMILQTKPDYYVATNVLSAEWAKQFSDRVTYIPLGADITRFQESFSPRPDHKTLEHPIVLCIAAFTAFKRHTLLIDAMAELQKGTLIMIGATGELEESIRKYSEKRIPGRYIMTQVPYNETPYYYKLCDVFTMASEGEAFGLVYLEALAANKPIVTTNDKARAVIVGNAGILCDVTNTNEYASALEKAATQNWGQLPLQHVKNNFTWAIVAAKYEDLLKSLVK